MDLYELLCHTPCPQQREAAEILQEMRVHRTQKEGGREKEDLIFVSGLVLYERLTWLSISSRAA